MDFGVIVENQADKNMENEVEIRMILGLKVLLWGFGGHNGESKGTRHGK